MQNQQYHICHIGFFRVHQVSPILQYLLHILSETIPYYCCTRLLQTKQESCHRLYVLHSSDVPMPIPPENLPEVDIEEIENNTEA